MRQAWELLRLKLRSLLGRRAALLIFLMLPLLMTLPAGLAERGNDASMLRALLADQAQNEDSRLLCEALENSEIQWTFRSYEAGMRSLSAEEADALVTVPADFSIPERPFVILESSRRPEALQVLVEDLAGAIMPLIAGEEMLKSLHGDAEEKGLSEAELKADFLKRLKEKLAGGHEIRVRVIGENLDSRRTLMVLPRWSPELLFLSLYSILGSLGLSDRQRRLRLLSRPSAFYTDYLAGLAALFFLGSLQIFLVMAMLKAVFPPFNADPRSFLLLFAFLATQLLIAQFIMLLPEQRQLLSALFLLFFSAFAGGAFVPLPSRLMQALGIYFPHGRFLALLEGMQLQNPVLFLLPLFLLAAWLQRAQLLRRN